MHAFLKTGKLGPPEKKATTSNTSNPRQITPWVEKYRPRTVEDVVEQAEAVEVLKQCMTGGDLPNLLFYGPPGTGKTSTILAACRQLFGEIYKDRILELNASDERGIQVIRDKVKTFAQTTANNKRPDGKPCPPFKIIILDEADSMTHAAQAALRRTMERETKTTRFCLICNYVSRIIPPLTSRCTKFRFKPLNEDRIISRLQYICEQEKIECDDSIMQLVVRTCNGDLRRAITCLQSGSRLKDVIPGADKVVTIETKDVYEVTGVVPDQWINDFVKTTRHKNYSDLELFVENFIGEAYSVGQLLEQLNEVIVYTKEFNKKEKMIICDKLGECSFRLQDGASEYLQLMDLGLVMLTCHKVQ